MSAKLPPVSKKGFLLPGPRAQVLLLHGYTGSPYDLKPLALFLNHHGLAVNVPLLLGHGTKAKKLVGISGQQWLQQAREELLKFDQDKAIFVGGLSMGACLAILLANSSPQIKALFLFSPALTLKISAELIISAAKFGLVSSQFSLPKFSGKSDIADPKARAKSPSYPQMPLSGLLEFDSLRRLSRDQIDHITIPIFMAFGQHDGAIDIQDCHDQILRNASGPVFSKFYPRSQHVITLDYDRELLYNDLWHFITNNLGL